MKGVVEYEEEEIEGARRLAKYPSQSTQAAQAPVIPVATVPKEMRTTVAPAPVRTTAHGFNVAVDDGSGDAIGTLLGPVYIPPLSTSYGLTQSSAQRKQAPMYEGLLGYFPNALAEVSRLSMAGNDKHNPGQSLHWAFDKSTDHGDCIVRHQCQAEEIDDEDGILHCVKVAWRALAQAETILLKRNPNLKRGKNVR